MHLEQTLFTAAQRLDLVERAAALSLSELESALGADHDVVVRMRKAHVTLAVIEVRIAQLLTSLMRTQGKVG